MLLFLLAACKSSTPDVDAYVEATRETARDPLAAADECGKVGGAAGDECVAWAADEQAKRDPDLAWPLCGRISDPVWQDECGFLVAEETVPRLGAEQAAKRCAHAGRFSDHCLMHVWKEHATELLAKEDVPTAAKDFAPALAWADGVIPTDAALEGRYWDLFFDAAQPPAWDLAWCDTVGDDLRARCRRALPASFQRALNRADRKPGAVDAGRLCDDSSTSSVAERISAASGISYVQSPELDAVARRFVERRCAGAPPEGGGPPAPGERSP